MTDISAELLEAVHAASACMVDDRELAGKFVSFVADEIDSLFLGFVDAGEVREVGRLLQMCAFNQVKLNPNLLCRCIGVLGEILDGSIYSSLIFFSNIDNCSLTPTSSEIIE